MINEKQVTIQLIKDLIKLAISISKTDITNIIKLSLDIRIKSVDLWNDFCKYNFDEYFMSAVSDILDTDFQDISLTLVYSKVDTYFKWLYTSDNIDSKQISEKLLELFK